MTKNYSFLCNKYERRNDGAVSCYILEVTNNASGVTEEVSIMPEELVSPEKMKRALLKSRIFYSATKTEHEQILFKIFSSRPLAI